MKYEELSEEEMFLIEVIKSCFSWGKRVWSFDCSIHFKKQDVMKKLNNVDTYIFTEELFDKVIQNMIDEKIFTTCSDEIFEVTHKGKKIILPLIYG